MVLNVIVIMKVTLRSSQKRINHGNQDSGDRHRGVHRLRQLRGGLSRVFRLNESLGHSEVINPTGAPEDQIQLAIDQCPVQCISWQEAAD